GFDAVIAQDAVSAYALASGVELPQVFVVHGFAPFEHPPQGVRPLPTVVALNDRIAARAAAMAGGAEIVRMRQPIDLWRFESPSPARERPRRVLAFSNYLQRDRLALLESACSGLGLELMTMGVTSTASVVPQQRIADADIVVGYGRSILEGMAMGRAAYVWDRGGGDGWVTPETYPAFEANGFAGSANEQIIDAERLREDFAGYRQDFGLLGYDLVRKHHSATLHVEELVGLLERAPAPTADPVNATFGLLARAHARAEHDRQSAHVQLRAKAEETEAQMLRLNEVGAAGEAERQGRLAAEQRLREAEGKLGEVLHSSSWRLTAPLRRLGRMLRVLRGR
ncbi:MAG TPA: hypothetical protein VLC07_07005, partial [Solirubrobacterales bacterium]|nr:hypothetical protein [Solirubrobacterales bacterium]